jgi:hypothetical protein
MQLDADLGQEAIGIDFDQREPLVVEHFHRPQAPGEEGDGVDRPGGPSRLPSSSTPAATSHALFHDVE